MTRRKNGGVPPYCRHKQSGRAYVRLAGKQHMLGPYGSPESWAKYRRLIAEWQAHGGAAPPEQGETYRVADLCADYLRHCEVYYRRQDGSPTWETDRVATSFRELLQLYRDTEAARFGIAELKTVRAEMIRRDLARATVNTRIGRIVRAFSWAAEELKVPAEVHGALRSLRRLKRGRSEARETDPVRAVPWEHVEPVLDHVSRQVRAMILLQWWSGMRPGEAVQLRPVDIERGGSVWIYRPQRHKAQHHGRSRVVGLGTQCQDVLRPFLDRVPMPEPDRQLFRPYDAVQELHAERREQRVTPLWKSHMDRNETKRKQQPDRVPGDAYDVASYRRAITRACKAAGVPSWSPNQLRHAAATRIRAELGIEAARVVLGHSSAVTSEIYAELDQRKAMDVMERLG